MVRFYAFLVLLLQLAPLHAWVVAPASTRNTLQVSVGSPVVASRLTTALPMGGGFGAAGDKKKKETKLKPKQQWDRLVALKKEDKVRVGVKATDEWLEVGSVKSIGNDHTEYAIARQRSLIVEHARRLYPTQVSPKDAVEWGFASSDDEWTVVDKAVVDTKVPVDVEKGKAIGFEGRPDPATGFYCLYNEGRLVNSESDVKPVSKYIQ